MAQRKIDGCRLRPYPEAFHDHLNVITLYPDVRPHTAHTPTVHAACDRGYNYINPTWVVTPVVSGGGRGSVDIMGDERFEVSRRGSGGTGRDRGKLPLGMQTFSEVRGSGDYYVDKTAFALKMFAKGKCYFLSRPRRFGKSLLVSMLQELFEGNEKLFEGLHIHSRWDWSVNNPVVRLSFGRGDFTNPDALKGTVNAQLFSVERVTGVKAGYAGLPEADRFVLLLEELHRQTGRRVVVLVDEYDKPILDALDTPEQAKANRNFLRGMYAAIKDADAHVQFVFLTGVSKFSKVSLFSGLNNLKDITLNPAFSSVCGFTEADLDRVFPTELEGLDRERVREWYNGYSWLGPERVYNPYDILTLLDERMFKAHWFETATPTFLVDTLMRRGVSTATLGGTWTSTELLSAFDVDHITTEALLFQTGYLTITGTQQQDDKTLYRLDYPNLEVRRSLNEALLHQLAGSEAFTTATTGNLMGMLRDGDTEGLHKTFEVFFSGIPYQWHTTGGASNYESCYATVFHICFSTLSVDVIAEDFTSRGRVDLVVRLPQRIWLFEFKVVEEHPTGEAMQQLQNRGYADKHRARGVPIHLVAIEFSRTTRNIAAYETTTL